VNDSDFMNESMDLKKLFLCLKKDLVRIIIVTIIGAVMCGGIYLVVREIRMGKVYQSYSQFYIEFLKNSEDEINQHFNAYTWNDLLHADPVINQIVIALKEVPENEKILNMLLVDEDLKVMLRDNTFKGEILSDRRLLKVTYTSDFEAKVSAIQQAMEKGLPIYAAKLREVESIELVRSTEPELIVWDNQLNRAIIGGAVLFLLLALFIWWFSYILDDSLYTLNDAEKRYHYPVAGILLKGEKIDAERLYFDELKENLSYFLRESKNPLYLSVCKTPYPDGAKLRSYDGVILEIPFGHRYGKITDRCVSYLRSQNIKILGLIITEADRKFIGLYYGGRDK